MFKKMCQLVITLLVFGLFSFSAIAAEKAVDAKQAKDKKTSKVVTEKPKLPACNFRISLS